MKLIAFVAVLLLASGAWGQQARQLTVAAENGNEICGLDAKGQPFLGSGYTWRQCAVLLMSIALPPAKQEKKAPLKKSAWVSPRKTDDKVEFNRDTYAEVPTVSFPCTECSGFDVAPKETDEWEPPLENNWQSLLANEGPILPCAMPTGTASTASYICVNGVVHYNVYHRTCTDKRRVLLMSEDKKWHCYFFAELRP